jgi:DNA invertase Pin-like site-specific DNA recombinase
MNVRSKVTAGHLARGAYLYVRQSSLRQVAENKESTRRQYGLRERATALGWNADQIHVIDSDLGQSGASAVGREGFQHLVAEVGLGRAGIVLGLEVSRLARNNADWHRLLEICALMRTLILDEDGIYDPAQYNDRLLLGLKGTMSEAELHLLRSRLRGGLLAKARRGELKLGLPIGLVYDASDRVVLHPDVQIRESVQQLFETFRRTGAVSATVKSFHRRSLLFPIHAHRGHRSLEALWRPLTLSRAAGVLHNPRYAGAFVYGRHTSGKVHRSPDEWTVLLLDHHPGYIDWAEYQRNVQRLGDNRRPGLHGPRRAPPREGAALLQGLVVCGLCGARMATTYHARASRLHPTYFCCRRHLDVSGHTCQSLAGQGVDEAVGQLVVDAMTPMALELTVAVQDELQSRVDEADSLRQRQVQRAEQEVERARLRYMQVDPANRLVASTLEADWNDALRGLDQARMDADRQRDADQVRLDAATRERIAALAEDFPALWADPRTPQRERKRMLALLIEDVTLVRGDPITVHVRFRGGATTTLSVAPAQKRKTARATVELVDHLLDEHTDSEISAILNERGHVTGACAPFDVAAVAWVRHGHRLPSLKQRLIAAGGITTVQLAQQVGVRAWLVREWARNGQLVARRCNDKGDRIFAPLEQQPASIRQRAPARATMVQPGPTAADPAGGAV